MSKAPRYTAPSSDAQDAFQSFLEGVAKLLLYAGTLASVLSLGYLLYTFIVFAGSAPTDPQSALNFIAMAQKVLVFGVIAVGVSTAYLFWGEETLGVLQIIGSALLFFAWMFLPGMVGAGELNQVGAAALGAVRLAGAFGGLIALGVIIGEVSIRVKLRSQEGAKADQLKYGKGVKEERDTQNVFLGKCWQLPFCRKFVREKCPIYHARRTCWRERVGCMCEEEVIRNAMEGKIIPKDMVAASKFIPYNMKLSPELKAERCRQCVIYNEHQKHKYKLALPLVLLGTGGFYLLLRDPMKSWMDTFLKRTDVAISKATYQEKGTVGLNAADPQWMTIFKEVLVVCLMLILMAYLMKLIEFLFFKLKV